MFWKYNTTSSAQIDSLLSKEDVSLNEVMDSEEIINECRGQNKNLIDFLLRPEVITELVTLTTKEPSIELNEKTRFKYPNIASELLTCDVPAINERLAGDKRLLEILYTFLENESPLNPLLASYFSKIMGALIAKKTEQNWLSYQFTCLQVLDFLKARDTFLPLLIKHLGTSAIMDLMLKLMTQVEGPEMRQNILNWLDSQEIIQKLVSLLNPQVEKERHDNVAQLFCDFIRIARENQRNTSERPDPDPLLNTLESSDTVSLILSQIFDGEKCESSIVGGIQVLLALLDVNQSSIAKYSAASIYNSSINDESMDVEQKQRIVIVVTEAICSRLKDFHDLLKNPPKQTSIVTTAGQLEPPLGNTRLQVIRLLAAIIPSNHTRLYDELKALSTFPVLLDLFFVYPWNNFLHTQVENCILAGLKASVNIESTETTPSSFCKHLLEECDVIELILDAWKENDAQQQDGKCIRQGYMGHLISIMNKFLELCSTTSLGQYFKDLKPETAKNLETFKDTTLAAVNADQEKLLAGVHPNISLENSDEFGEAPYSQSNIMQQQYQMQHLRSQYIDVYSGVNDDAFNDGDTLQTIDNPSDINFDLSENDVVQRDDIFKQVCAQNINTLYDGDEQIIDEKDHTFQTVIEKQGDQNEEMYSSDSDDGSPSGDDNMDVDPWSSPKPDPWNTLANATENSSSNWADFSTAFVDVSAFASFNKDAKECSMNEQTESPPVLQNSESSNDPDGSPSVNRSASGDHKFEAEAKPQEGEKSQTTGLFEGDLPKPEEKQQNNAEAVQADNTEKV
ncbi:phosphatase 6 regulatory subunit 1-like protein fmt isoform X2 [Rhynchophorus ferrugineus]|uniref:phosphatase 6 regulatory subunit 1-like protein fmt isoform X2 n=1 Tax=Rhynchophorus ferrugineus TaxID=354439 RepID=UPI003FCC4CD0